MKFYLVGGAVRDRLLDLPVQDQDFVVVGATPKQMLDNGYVQVGADFPVFLDKFGREFALARKERKVGHGYHGFETNFDTSVTLEDDLFRRDLTINAMAIKVRTFLHNGEAVLDDEIIDPFNGQEDLKNGVVRHVSKFFAEDPVRVLRAARFAARFDFTISPDTKKLMNDLVVAGELDHLTTERVWLELEKTMKNSKSPFQFFSLLNEVGALRVVLPELDVAALHKAELMLTPPTVDSLTLVQRFAALVFFMDLDDARTMFGKVRAPLAIAVPAVKTLMARNTFVANTISANTFMQVFKQTDAFRDPKCVDVIVGVFRAATDPLDKLHHVADLLPMSFLTAKQISFDSLNLADQNRLQGAEIAHAIEKLRVAEIRSLLTGE